MDIPNELKWQNAPFRGQPGTFQHSLVYVLADCLQVIKSHRDRHRPTTLHCNTQLTLLACAFFESALSRGLVNAAQFRLRTLPPTRANAPVREALERCVAQLFDGDTYGNPILPTGPSASRYGKAVRCVLDLDLDQVIRPEVAQGVRCLFLLRNIVVHGQTVAADARFPDKFEDPVPHYQLRPTDNITELDQYLRQQQVGEPMSLKHGIGFPFLNDTTTDHFLRRIVEYFRSLQDAIGDRELGQEFGGGLPQHLFPFLAGECFFF